MRSRPISDDEFIKLTRGLSKFITPNHGELTHFSQKIIDEATRGSSMELSFATTFESRLKISHLRVLIKEYGVLRKPVNLTLDTPQKKEMYILLKAMADINMN